MHPGNHLYPGKVENSLFFSLQNREGAIPARSSCACILISIESTSWVLSLKLSVRKNPRFQYGQKSAMILQCITVFTKTQQDVFEILNKEDN